MSDAKTEVKNTPKNTDSDVNYQAKGHKCQKCGKFHKWPEFVPKYYDIPIIHVCECNCATQIHNGKTKRLKDAVD